jgi:penicillin-binding protein 1A
MARVNGRKRASPGAVRVRPLVPRPKKKKRGKKRAKRRSPAIKINANAILQWTLTSVAVLILTFVFGIGVLATGLPSTEDLLSVHGAPSVTFLDVNGKMIARRGAGQGTYLGLDEMPPHLAQAVLAIEDRRFYDHWGIDVTAVGRALVANVEARRVVQGGSTITQQLAKNLFLESDRTFVRKLQEAILSFYLEMRFEKGEILAMYLNRAYFGAGAFGIDAASRRYFNKSARDVTLPEAAILAGLLKAPSRYSPANSIDLAEERSRVVLNAMVEVGYISDEARDRAATTRPKLSRAEATPGTMYFVDWVMDKVPDYIGGLTTDLVIETTLDLEMQRAAESSINDVLLRDGETKKVSEGALLAMDGTGAVRAMVGGRSYARSQYNRATQAERQPGSAFKPFVFLAAVEDEWSEEQTILDAPISIKGWSPQNFEGKYEGRVTLGRALARSLNSATVRLLMDQSVDRVIATARKLGINSRLVRNASLALGTSEVTLSELVASYVPFANGGDAVSPRGIARIRTSSGHMLFEQPIETLGHVVQGRHVARMNRMMAETLIHGTGRSARLVSRVAAGKTGTTQNFRDALFIGFTGGFVAGVWVGNDDGAPMVRVTGGTLPAEIWKRFMTQVDAKLPDVDLIGADALVVAALEHGPSPVSLEPAAPPGDEDSAGAFDEILDSLFGDSQDATH